VISKELERAGIPVVQVANMTPVANSVGVNRIWTSASIKYPLGSPDLDPEAEKIERIRMTRSVLEELKE